MDPSELHQACFDGDSSNIHALIEKYDAVKNVRVRIQRKKDGKEIGHVFSCTPAQLTILTANPKNLKALLDAGVKDNLDPNVDSETKDNLDPVLDTDLKESPELHYQTLLEVSIEREKKFITEFDKKVLALTGKKYDAMSLINLTVSQQKVNDYRLCIITLLSKRLSYFTREGDTFVSEGEKDYSIESYIYCSASKLEPRYVRAYVRAEKKVDFIYKGGETPLHVAGRIGNTVNLVTLILGLPPKGEDPDVAAKTFYGYKNVDVKSSSGKTPLFEVVSGISENDTKKVRYSRLRAIRILLRAGANPYLKCDTFGSPYELAQEYAEKGNDSVLKEFSYPNGEAPSRFELMLMALYEPSLLKKEQLESAKSLVHQLLPENDNSIVTKHFIPPVKLNDEETLWGDVVEADEIEPQKEGELKVKDPEKERAEKERRTKKNKKKKEKQKLKNMVKQIVKKIIEDVIKQEAREEALKKEIEETKQRIKEKNLRRAEKAAKDKEARKERLSRLVLKGILKNNEPENVSGDSKNEVIPKQKKNVSFAANTKFLESSKEIESSVTLISQILNDEEDTNNNPWFKVSYKGRKQLLEQENKKENITKKITRKKGSKKPSIKKINNKHNKKHNNIKGKLNDVKKTSLKNIVDIKKVTLSVVSEKTSEIDTEISTPKPNLVPLKGEQFGLTKARLPDSSLQVFTTLWESGFPVFINDHIVVGLIRGLPLRDFNIVMDAPLQQIQLFFPTGIVDNTKNTVSFYSGEYQYTVTSLSQYKKPGDDINALLTKHSSEVIFNCCALYWDADKNILYDPRNVIQELDGQNLLKSVRPLESLFDGKPELALTTILLSQELILPIESHLMQMLQNPVKLVKEEQVSAEI